METLGVAIIMKDELIDRLALQVDFMSALASEFSIVDTGSKDFEINKPLIEGWGHNVKLNQFEWIDDFSAARNYGLQFLTTDWVLHLDCDELPSYPMMKSIERILNECDPQIAGWLHFTRNFWGGERGIEVEAHWHCRLFRRSRGIWYKPLHEQVQLDGRQEGFARGSILLPNANREDYLIHSKPREKINVSAALYEKMEQKQGTW